MGLSPTQDAGGNVKMELEGTDPDLSPWCYAAYLDEIAILLTCIRESGDLDVARSGSLYPWKLDEDLWKYWAT